MTKQVSMKDMKAALLSRSMYPTQFDTGWVVIHRPFEPDNVGAESVGIGATEEEAIRNAYALLPAPPPQKKSKHDGMIRGFYHLAEAWYADANLKSRTDGLVDDITIGFYTSDGKGGTTGEFKISWTEELGGKLVPQLCVYDNAWEALSHFSDLLTAMEYLDNTNPTPQEFCEILTRLGITDLTPRKQS